MDRANNFIYYLLIVIILAGAAFFFHSYLLAVVVLGCAVLPVISVILLKLCRKHISLDIRDNVSRCKRDEVCTLRITLKNKSLVPLLNCNFRLTMLNDFSGQAQKRYINTSVPAMGKRVIELEFKPVLCGKINIQADELCIRDLLNFFEYELSDKAKMVINVMPRRIKLTEDKQTCDSISDESEKPHKDSAGTEVINVREYMPGDSLKTIHWKLSAKKDDLFVKERGDNIVEQAVLIFELTTNAINATADTVYAVARHYARDNMPIKICWAGSGDEQLKACTIYEESDIFAMFEQIYLSIPTNTEGHSLSVAKRQLSGGAVMYVSSLEEGVVQINL